MKDFQLVQHVLALSDNEFQNSRIQLKDTGNNKICSATLSNNTQYYQCFDCCKEPNHVYCQECFMPEKQQIITIFILTLDHVVTYDYLKFGFCDCGDVVKSLFLLINKYLSILH
ncbi:unnamed protein product [Paramecium pentaurelia]|uniref:UBR-type domain-containing protein n=1 Tax=Paramecium pentaurelia TaxID=43138 RepID=A0A8S1TRF5_9CILI|nr:unnamed protein product [Paramecium pentaurelia]